MDEPARILGQADFHNQTTVHPIGLLVLLLLGIAMLLLPRRRAMIAVVACASFIAVGQRVVLFSLDFNFLRLMVLFGWARILLHQEYRDFQWQTLDRWFVAWAMAALMMHSISHGAGSIVYKLGATFDALGMYFLVRMLVRDLNDVKGLIETLAFISIPVMFLFLVEYQTQRNLFAVFGGVPEITMIREGKLRCQGAYSHPILAGCFWAALIPLFVGRLSLPGLGRIWGVSAVFAAGAIVGMCSSSTPVCGVLAAMVGFILFLCRRSMAYVRWGTVLLLLCLHFSMQNPVWHLIARTDLIGGSTGWHRFHLIDQFINHFGEWAPSGLAIIRHWNVFMDDITNHYVLEGLRGGLVPLMLFLTMMAVAFTNIGRMCNKVRSNQGMLVWSLGVSVFVHAVNFIGVSYFGQISMLWYISLAMTVITIPKTLDPAADSTLMSYQRIMPQYRILQGPRSATI